MPLKAAARVTTLSRRGSFNRTFWLCRIRSLSQRHWGRSSWSLARCLPPLATSESRRKQEWREQQWGERGNKLDKLCVNQTLRAKTQLFQRKFVSDIVVCVYMKLYGIKSYFFFCYEVFITCKVSWGLGALRWYFRVLYCLIFASESLDSSQTCF